MFQEESICKDFLKAKKIMIKDIIVQIFLPQYFNLGFMQFKLSSYSAMFLRIKVNFLLKEVFRGDLNEAISLVEIEVTLF